LITSVEKPRGFRGVFRADPNALAVYSEAAGIQRITPKAIAVPEDVEDLVTLVNWAQREGTPLIPRGSGSSMSGGAIGPGAIVDLSRWKDIGKVEGDRITVGPGAICGDVNSLVAPAGLRFPVQPSSAAFCTIGGMTATNAAGASTFAYGPMRAWLDDIECVMSDGSLVITSGAAARDLLSNLKQQIPRGLAARDDGLRVLKNSSGYFTGGTLKDLLVGSEGTLAFFTRIHLRLQRVPRFMSTVVGWFGSLEAATRAAINARESGAATCEMLDRTFLSFLKGGEPPDEASLEALLIADVESDREDELHEIERRVAHGFVREGLKPAMISADEEDRKAIWHLRHAASPLIAQLGNDRKSMQFIEDGCVPPESLGRYVAGVRAALDRQEIPGVIFGHAGDAHVHVNPLVPVSEGDWRQRVEELRLEVTDLVAALGGTVSGEHGDGRIRTPLLDRVWSAEKLAEFRRVKEAFDPAGILNPGVKIPDGSGIGDIKYDPTLPSHPEQARMALRKVESDRAYGRYRLEMLAHDIASR
jgi:FAD/FMN-containing dehydrogenase